MIEIITPTECPEWLVYPKLYLGLVDNGKDKFLPWFLVHRERALIRWAGLKKRYKSRCLFPFALKDCTDDIACWEKGQGDKVFIIHDYTDPGWEKRECFNNFSEWYEWALKQEY